MLKSFKQIQKIVGSDDLGSFGYDPSLSYHGLIEALIKLAVDRLGKKVIVDVSDTEGGQLLFGRPDQLGLFNGLFYSLIVIYLLASRRSAIGIA